MLDVIVDYSELIALPGVVEAALRAGLDQAAEATAETERALVPRRRGLLARGIEVKHGFPVATVQTSALAQTPKSGVYQSPGGERRPVTFRNRPAHDYAPDVDEGTGPIRPVNARALLIEVAQAPAGESFIVADGRFFIFRRSARGQRAQRYSERTANTVAPRLPAIFVAEIDRA